MTTQSRLLVHNFLLFLLFTPITPLPPSLHPNYPSPPPQEAGDDDHPEPPARALTATANRAWGSSRYLIP